MTNKIVSIPKSLSPEAIKMLQNEGFELITQSDDNPLQELSNNANTNAIIASGQKFSAEAINNLPALQVIARAGVGYDNVDVQAATKDGVWVTNTPGANSKSMAEGTILMILAVLHNFYNTSTKMQDGDWNYGKNHPGNTLAGKTVGIVGFGNMGRDVYNLLQPFGVNVLVYNRHDKNLPDGVQVPLNELLQKSDIVSLHLASTPETYHIIDKEAFKLMKPNAHLINLGRGSLVDTNALLMALNNRQIASAGLDTFESEPLPMDSPLRHRDDIILTPHAIGITVESNNSMSINSAQNVIAVLNGQTPPNPVNQIK